MTTAVATIKNKAKAYWNIVRQIAPYVISLSDDLSTAYAKHQTRLARVAWCKELMLQEMHTLVQIRRDLSDRYYQAPPEERLRLKRDLDEAERELRKLQTYSIALEHLSSAQEDPEEEGEQAEHETHISSHWMDKFNECAKANNEQWRQALLARALALEASNPGVVGARAVWLIGTIEEQPFHAYAALLDISSVIHGRYAIPNPSQFANEPIPTCSLGPNLTIGC